VYMALDAVGIIDGHVDQYIVLETVHGHDLVYIFIFADQLSVFSCFENGNHGDHCQLRNDSILFFVCILYNAIEYTYSPDDSS